MKTKIYLMAMITVLIFGCSNEEVRVDERPQMADGREIAGAIFFYTGEYAKEIPSFQPQLKKLQELLNNNPDYIAEYELEAESLLDKVGQKDPGYFARLEKAVHSGNFNETSRVVHEGYNLITFTNRLGTLASLEALSQQEILAGINLNEFDFSSIEDLERLDQIVEDRFTEAGIDLEEALDNLRANERGGDDASRQFCLALPGIALAYRIAANFIYVVNFNTQFNININQNFNLNRNIQIPRIDEASFSQERLITEIVLAFQS